MVSPLDYKGKIDIALQRFFDEKAKGKSGIELDAIRKLREFTLRGGKRIRPAFMLMGYWLNGEIDDRIINAAISLELMQSYLLIHDDIIDHSDVRRGGPSFHRMFNFSDSINEGLAIVCADLSDAYSHEILLDSQFPQDRLNAAMKIMAVTVEMTGIGQLMDITLSLSDNVSVEDVIDVHKYKTAQYTINGPIKMGATLAGYEDVGRLDDYGIPLGIAFQIQDDILGMFGDEQQIGKSILSDFLEGKKTHLILYTYQLADSQDADFVRQRLGKSISIDEFNTVREIIKKSGALDKTKNLAENYYRMAIASIENITEDPVKRAELKRMADVMVRRVS
ncbi:MAG: polyprenyl synthetase family protein [Thermoplasmatales archaeon]